MQSPIPELRGEDPVFGAGWALYEIDLGVDDEGPVVASLVHRERGVTPLADWDSRRGRRDPEQRHAVEQRHVVKQGRSVEQGHSGEQRHVVRQHDGDQADAHVHQQGPHGDDPAAPPPILVLHGWSDYVLDRHLLDRLGEQGHDVWGLDLRKHGRSLRAGQTPTEIDHLNRYDEEIGAALRLIGRPPVILAHSTGGLTATLYAQRHPRAIRALALNSPWLEMHLGAVVRGLLHRPVGGLARCRGARRILPVGMPHYARTTHRNWGGRFDYELDWKPPGGHAFPADTLAAVLDGQRRLEAAGPLAIPVLVLRSDRSVVGPVFTESMRRADTVLDVRTMTRAACRLGSDVQIDVIPGARHDVFLSDADARARAITALERWLRALSPAAYDVPERT
ncbi:alpha/beta hydrolase [Brachybacterium timonense]|uniref:alpha/beta hydrolase n=1 Tax=Brachybacterium timonense TaxID=2050896 RepID=UPI000D0B758A|nr:alpha/beta hydrolase [Brachybacterium timonense]